MHPNFGNASSPGTDLGSLAVKFQRAFALHQSGQWPQAQALYADIVKAWPLHAEALHYLGVIYAQNRDPQKALTLISRAVEIKPDYFEAHYNHGNVLKDMRQFEAAVASYDKAIALRPDYAEAYGNRGVALKALGKFEAALACYDKAIELNSRYIEAHYNRGNVLKDLRQFEAAIASYDNVLTINPKLAIAHVNRGNALKELAQFDLAVASYDWAIALDARLADAYWNKSLILLLRHDFQRGWPLYEWRWKNGNRNSSARNFTQPPWLGRESIAGKTVLLHSEQGLGDTIQFCRYAKLVSDLGARVILEVYPALAGLLKSLAGVSKLIVKGAELPPFDCHCPLMSLPLAFNTDLDSIPSSPHYINFDVIKAEKWKDRLGEKTKLRVGLVWSGNADHKNDHNRSVRLSDLMNTLSGDYQYVSLQKEVREIDRPVLESNPHLLHFGDQLEDFEDTAALCALMDLVISVDTSVAHLSGALGRPTWILLPFAPDWRWSLDTEHSAWYPSVKLYRQPAIEDWANAFAKLSADLRKFIAR